MPITAFNRDDLPAPFGPNMYNTSPLESEKEMQLSSGIPPTEMEILSTAKNMLVKKCVYLWLWVQKTH
jgi:hypothetical protein